MDRNFSPSNYWKPKELRDSDTIKDYLTIKNYSFDNHVSKALLKKHVARARSGLLSYRSCDTEELVEFSKARDIRVANQQDRAQLITRLEHADEHLSFKKLLDLPAELRCRIYTFYLGDLEIDGMPTQPPLTRVSRLLRKEALPLFYQICDFKMHVSRQLFQDENGVPKAALSFSSSQSATLLYSSNPGIASFRKQLRKLTVLGLVWLRIDGAWSISECSLSVGQGFDKVGESLRLTGFNGEQEGAVRKEIEKRAQETLDIMTSRDDKWKFEKGDDQLLLKVFA